jgi:predicted DNA-binding transcriptional regulator AlpA
MIEMGEDTIVDMTEAMIGMDEVVRRLGTSRPTIYRLVHRGLLHSFHPRFLERHRVYFLVREVEAIANERARLHREART